MYKIYKTLFGSHLYGTNTPTSDLDYKGVFIDTLDQIILKEKTNTIFENVVDKNENGRNTSEAIDCEWIELRRFIKDCLDGQTYALDMLFSNLEELTHPIWKDIIANREKLLSKDVAPYIGYCRHQANKYGLKGSRLGELLRIIELFKTFPSNDTIQDHIDEIGTSDYVTIEQYQYINSGVPIIQHFLVVLGRKFELRTRIKDVFEPLRILNDKYGARAVEAMNNEGIDWKAISHAFRCMYQLDELADTGKIVFPLEDAEFLKEIKQGKHTWEYLNNVLFDLMENTISNVEHSNLPDKPDYEFWNNWLVKKYRELIKNNHI